MAFWVAMASIFLSRLGMPRIIDFSLESSALSSASKDIFNPHISLRSLIISSAAKRVVSSAVLSITTVHSLSRTQGGDLEEAITWRGWGITLILKVLESMEAEMSGLNMHSSKNTTPQRYQ